MSGPFRLNQVLGHARLKEEAQAIEFAAVEAEYRRAHAALARLRDQEAAQLNALAEAARAGAFDPMATEAARHYLARLETSITEHVDLVAALAARVEASRAQLLAVTREKRLLERLEERHDENAAADVTRRERAQADELSGQRYERMRRQSRGEVA